MSRDRPVGREELIGALWPDHAPRSQDAALRTLLSRLRSVLGPSVLVGRDELVLELPEPAWVDIEAASLQVERADQALQAGDPRGAWALAQVPLNIASRGLLPRAQAVWLDSRRRELADVRLRALEVIGRAGLAMGGTQLGSVQRAARALITAEPYRESGYVLLMQSLEMQGNVAEALRVFDQLRTLLRDELGTAPSPDAIAAYEVLLRPRHGRRSRTMPTAARKTGIRLRRRRPSQRRGLGRRSRSRCRAELRALAAPAMIGRVAELEELERWLSQGGIIDPRSERVLLIAGDPGIGKTRLLAEPRAARTRPGRWCWPGARPRRRWSPSSHSSRRSATTSRPRRCASCAPYARARRRAGAAAARAAAPAA